MIRLPVVVLGLGLVVAACAGVEDGSELTGEDICSDGTCDVNRSTALCTVKVSGRGNFDVETTYLPGVIACENPEGSAASLRAQAIAARSYLYQVAGSRGSIRDGVSDQVFSCGKAPRAEHIRAVEETSGQFLRYKGTTVAAFYVAGAKQSGPSCTGGTRDSTRTEKWVTYNQDKTGSGVKWCRLGSNVDANRGAMSQNGANCQSDNGRSTEEILRYYYGADIEIVQATGACIEGPVPEVEDIGLDCQDDFECEERCELTATTDGIEGMCSAACEWGCPGNSECVDLGTGDGRCAPLTGFANQFCETLPGFEATVLQTAKGKWKSVCAPLALETSCSVGGFGGGECIDTEASSCGDGTLHTGACPGPSNIRCCTP